MLTNQQQQAIAAIKITPIKAGGGRIRMVFKAHG
jgi:hypothetical protein